MEKCPTPPCYCGIDCQAVQLHNHNIKYCTLSNNYEYVRIPKYEREAPNKITNNHGYNNDRNQGNQQYLPITYENGDKTEKMGKHISSTFDFN